MSFIKWFIFLFLAFGICSAICGVAEYSMLGPYASQGVWSPFFNTFEQVSKGNWGSIVTLALDPDTYGSILQMLVWNYAIFDGTFGSIVKFLILWPLSAAFIFCFIITLVSTIPIIGRGGQ